MPSKSSGTSALFFALAGIIVLAAGGVLAYRFYAYQGIQAPAGLAPINGSSPPSAPQAKIEGTLQGIMTIGPICPVERIDHPCIPSPETYAAHPVYVYRSDQKALVVTLVPDANGRFQTILPAGNYWIDVAHPAVGGVQGAPAAVSIKAGLIAHIVIDIDTGIR